MKILYIRSLFLANRNLLEHIDRDMMDKKLFDHVLSSTDIPLYIGSRMAARSPMAASIAMRPHNRCVSLRELRVYEGDLEKIYNRFRNLFVSQHIAKPPNSNRIEQIRFTTACKKLREPYLSVVIQVNR
jgi:hypothetical protein